ncbi:site-specific integrase [Streptomyces sp. NBC_01451]
MRVQRVLAPGSTTESWTLLGDDLRPVDPVESFLAYLTAVERSPNTVKAYAHDLKDWWVYLDGRGLGWKSVDLEAVAAFVAWLRLPPLARSGGGGGAADGRASLHGFQREPQARRGQHVLRVSRPQRHRGRRPATSRSCSTSPPAGPSGPGPSSSSPAGSVPVS